MSKLLASAVLGFGFAFAATAAEPPASIAAISKIDGQVMVNQGQDFAPAQVGMRLKPGDRIMVQEDSEVTLNFDDECRLEVDENKLVTVPDRSTCAGAVLAEQPLTPEGGEAIGSGVTHGNGGVAVMVAVVAAIDIWAISEGDDELVSP
jgi:hypothetical protein